jgi:hypothetical protein
MALWKTGPADGVPGLPWRFGWSFPDGPIQKRNAVEHIAHGVAWIADFGWS